MNTGQTMLTIAAIFFLSITILNVNRGLLTANSVISNNRYDILSVSLATSIIEKAIGKAFDQQSDTVAIAYTNLLTPKANLGLDGTESMNNPDGFNDVDDYNCYRNVPKVDTIALQGTNRKFILNTYCKVDYVNANDPSIVANSPTWTKRLTVRVFSPGMPDTVQMSTVYGYWFFR